MELVQEPLAVDMDVRKAIKISKHWTLKNFRATQVEKFESFVAGSLILLQDKRAANIHEGFQLDPSSRLARTSKDLCLVMMIKSEGSLRSKSLSRQKKMSSVDKGLSIFCR